MQFDAGTWWLAVLLLGGLTGALGYMIKHSFDKIEKKLDTAVPKEDFDTKIANHEAQIRKIQETYTPRTTHDKDVGELREKISRISENCSLFGITYNLVNTNMSIYNETE